MKRTCRGCRLPAPPAGSAAPTADSLETVKAALAAGTAVLIDVRDAAEWAAGHLRDARHLALSEIVAGPRADRLTQSLPAGAVVYVHCAMGRRSLAAADALGRRGYDARPLADGYEALLRAGFGKAE